jgi:DNA-binding CsgD family transcriptional regulator
VGQRGRANIAERALLERELELQAIDDRLRAACAGDGSALLVRGPAGIGKTALLRASGARGRELGMRVVASAGSEFERSVAYGLVTDLAQGLGAGGGDSAAHAVLDAVRASAGATPLLIAVDDVQWADASSLRFLAGLSRRLAETRTLLLVGIRDGDESADPTVLDAIADQAPALRPAPLSREACAALAAERFGEPAHPAFADACFDVTAGNPYGLVELVETLRQDGVRPHGDALRAVGDAGARTTSRLVQRRLRRLPDEAVAIAQVAAVLGRAADRRLLASLAGVDPEAARDALGVLLRAGLTRSGQPVEFVHPLVRGAVLEGIPAERRSALRAAAAASLTARGRTEEAAEQLLDLPPAGDAGRVEVLEGAARLAAARGAPEVANGLLLRALAEPPPADRRSPVLCALGSAQAELGAPGALDTLREALDAAPDPAATVAPAAALGWSLAVQGRGAEGIAVLEACRAGLRATEGGLAVEVDAQIADQATWEAPLRPAGQAALQRLRESADRSPLARAAVHAAAALDASAACEPAPVVIELAERALADSALLDHPRSAPTACAMVCVIAFCGRPDLAEHRLERVLARLRRNGSLVFLRAAEALGGMLALMRGRLPEADAALRALLAPDPLSPQAAPMLRASPFLLAFLVRCLVARGRFREAAELVRGAQFDGPLPELVPVTPFLHARGLLRLARGDAHGARADLTLCGERSERERQRNPAVTPWRSALARALLVLGDDEQAAALAAQELSLAERLGAPHTLGAALTVRAATVPGDERLALLERAVAVLEPSFARLELADALTELGAAQLDAADMGAARASLGAALGLARDMGAEPLARRAAERLHAAGGRPRRARHAAPHGLTPAQLRVAQLAAAGRTNREIAEELFLSPKTVETHLRTTFRKLSIGSRSQLPEALAG